MKNPLKTPLQHTEARTTEPARNRNKIILLLGIALLATMAAFLTGPVSQSQNYHHFADAKTVFAIPNFWNIVSNIPFLLVGMAGLLSISQRSLAGMFPQLYRAYGTFFTGIFLTGLGSACYHFAPATTTLLYDRLPMTIAFMAFFAIIIGEFISLKAGKTLLLPLILTGLASVFYWNFTERNGHGDLRFYGLVQFLPMLLIPVILLLFPARTNTNLPFWLVLLSYLAAKIFELYDAEIFNLTHQISGHTLKHLAASLAPLLFLMGLYRRRIKPYC